MSHPANPAEIVALLEGRQDDELVGMEEAVWLDFKGAPYRLDERREQWELAKDVAALANATGGIIVLGVHTTRPSGSDEEIATKVSAFPESMFDPNRARDVVAAQVYPRIEIDVRTFNRAEDKRLAVIVVRQQDEDRRPFLLTHVFDDERRWEAIAFPVRSGTHTAFEPPGMLHRDIADGRRFRRSPATDLIREPLAEPGPDTGDLLESAEAWSREAVSQLTLEVGWGDYAVVGLTAVPFERRRRPDDFYANDGVRTSFAYDKQLRHSGFGISYALDVRVGDQEITSLDADRTVVRVNASGRVIAACAGTAEFLGWANDSGLPSPQEGARRPLRVNPVAMNEWVYEFCRFIYREVFPRWGNSGWAFTALVLRAQSGSRPLRLRAGLQGVGPSRGQPAEADDRVDSLEPSGDPAVDAIALLSVIYGTFGLGLDRIPFNHDGRFDEAKLLGLH